MAHLGMAGVGDSARRGGRDGGGVVGVSVSASRLIALEQYQEILNQLTPGQLVVVALRLDDMSHNEIAQELGLTKQAVSARIRAAARQIANVLPHLAYNGHRSRQYKRPDDLTNEEQLFLVTLEKIKADGGIATTTVIAKTAGLHRSTASRLSLRLRDRGLIGVGNLTGGSLPLHRIG